MMQSFILDFSNCKTQRQLHEHIKEILNLPIWYGNNLDALWDVLTGMLPLPAEITVKFNPKDISDRLFIEYLGKTIGVFLSAQQYTASLMVHINVNF